MPFDSFLGFFGISNSSAIAFFLDYGFLLYRSAPGHMSSATLWLDLLAADPSGQLQLCRPARRRAVLALRYYFLRLLFYLATVLTLAYAWRRADKSHQDSWLKCGPANPHLALNHELCRLTKCGIVLVRLWPSLALPPNAESCLF